MKRAFYDGSAMSLNMPTSSMKPSVRQPTKVRNLPVAAGAARCYLWAVAAWCVVVESELAAPATTATAAPMAIRALVLSPATVPPTAAPVAPAAGAAAAGAGAGVV
jgi:hypothetical protein